MGGVAAVVVGMTPPRGREHDTMMAAACTSCIIALMGMLRVRMCTFACVVRCRALHFGLQGRTRCAQAVLHVCVGTTAQNIVKLILDPTCSGRQNRRIIGNTCRIMPCVSSSASTPCVPTRTVSRVCPLPAVGANCSSSRPLAPDGVRTRACQRMGCESVSPPKLREASSRRIWALVVWRCASDGGGCRHAHRGLVGSRTPRVEF